MALWSGEVLERGLDDTHTELNFRINAAVNPGEVLGSLPGLRKDVCLIGSTISSQGSESYIIDGAAGFSRPITLTPCGERAHREAFGPSLRAARMLCPSLDGIAQISVSKGGFATARITLTSNKERTLICVQPCAIEGLLDASDVAPLRPDGDGGAGAAPSPASSGLRRQRAGRTGAAALGAAPAGEQDPLVWAKCRPVDPSGGKNQLLKFRQSAVVGVQDAQPPTATTAGGASASQGQLAVPNDASPQVVRVLGMRSIQRTLLFGKTQSLVPFSVEMRPVPVSALLLKAEPGLDPKKKSSSTSNSSGSKGKDGAAVGAESEPEPSLPPSPWPALPLLTLFELCCAFGEVKALLEGSWADMVTSAVVKAQAAVRGWRARRLIKAGQARKSRVMQGLGQQPAPQQGVTGESSESGGGSGEGVEAAAADTPSAAAAAATAAADAVQGPAAAEAAAAAGITGEQEPAAAEAEAEAAST